MMPKQVTDLAESAIAAFDSEFPIGREVNNAHQRAAEQQVASGLGLSGMIIGRFAKLLAPYLENRAALVGKSLKEAVSATELQPYAELETDLQTCFEHYMSPAVQAAQAGLDRMGQATWANGGGGAKAEITKMLPRIKSELKLFAAQHATAMTRRKEQTGGLTVHYHQYGTNNGRINVGSNDYSNNISESHVVFAAIKLKANEIEDKTLQAQIIAKTDELQAHIGKPSAWKIYNEWVGIVANHMQVFGSFIPALTDYLNQSGIMS